MAITTPTTKIRYVGDGSATYFPGPFPVYNAAHVKVFTPNEDGMAEEMVAGFNVFLEEDRTCSINFYEPLPAGQAITIARLLPLEQPLDLVNGGNFSAEEIELAFDETVMQIQQLAEELDRAIKLSITSDSPAQNAEEIYAQVAAIAQRAEDALLQIQSITQTIILAKGVTNLRGTWSTSAALPVGSLLRLPVGYFPGRHMLLLMVDGLTCHPAGADVPGDLPQYEEVGGEDAISRDVRLLFKAPAGAVWSAWAIASNVSQHQEEMAARVQQAKETAVDAAARAHADASKVAALVNAESLASSVFNVRRPFVADVAVASGQVLTLPAYYYPTRDVLDLRYEGLVCVPRKVGVEAAGAYQYEEVGTDSNVPSNQVIVWFDAKVGDVFDMWVVSSAAGRNIEELEQLAADAQAAASGAQTRAADAKTQADRAESAAACMPDVALAEDGQIAVARNVAGVMAARYENPPSPTVAEQTQVIAAALTAGTPYTVPAYVVGSKKLQVFVGGLHYDRGENAASAQYQEIGTPGAVSTQISFFDDQPAGAQITAIAAG